MSNETVTDDRLRELTERARDRAGVSRPAEGVERSEQSEQVNCGKCGKVFEPGEINVGGFRAYRQRNCYDCVRKDRELREKLDEQQRQSEAEAHAREIERDFQRLLERMGGNPWEHGHATLENFDTSESGPKPRQMAMQFSDAVVAAGPYDRVRGLYLYGETGPGKTHLAVGILRHVLLNGWKGQRIIFDNAAELIARIQNTYGRKGLDTFDVLEKRFDAGLWVLDDLGTERYSDDVVRHMTLIFTRRAMRPTLITSNYSPERLEQERPELWRMLSRLGPAYFAVVEVRGRDRRFDGAA